MAKNHKSNGKRRRYRFVSGKKKGMPPGSLVHTGESSVDYVRIRLTKYSHESYESATSL